MGQTTVYGANTVCYHWKAFGVAPSSSLGTLWPCETPPVSLALMCPLPQRFLSPSLVLSPGRQPPRTHFTDGEAGRRRRRLEGGLSPGPSARGVWHSTLLWGLPPSSAKVPLPLPSLILPPSPGDSHHPYDVWGRVPIVAVAGSLPSSTRPEATHVCP